MSHKSQFCPTNLTDAIGWLVDCGLTSHLAILQLYSDGTVVNYQR